MCYVLYVCFCTFMCVWMLPACTPSCVHVNGCGGLRLMAELVLHCFPSNSSRQLSLLPPARPPTAYLCS